MSKVTQVVEMLRVAEASMKELEKLRSFGTVVHSTDFLQSLSSKKLEKLPVSDGSWERMNPSVTDASGIGNQTDIQTVEIISMPQGNELSAHAELQTISEKLNQVIQLQDDVLSNLKADLDVLTVENHYLAKLNYTMKEENENLLHMLESLELEAKELKELILEMEEKESSRRPHEPASARAADLAKCNCETSTSNPKIIESPLTYHSKALQTKPNGAHEDEESRRQRLAKPSYRVFENTAVGETKRSVFIRAFLKLFRLYNNNNK